MGKPRIHVGLEIGTTKTVMVVAEVKPDGSVKILGLGETSSAGVRKGEIVDYPQIRACVKAALLKAEDLSDVDISSVFLSVTGPHIEGLNNRGTYRLPEGEPEIRPRHVEEVKEIASDIAIPSEHVYLHSLIRHYAVDGQPHATMPTGLMGRKLAAGFNIATIEKIIGKKKIARLMPNLPSAYGKGLTAIKFKNVKDIEINKIIKLLKIFSVPMIIKKEDLFDSITSISGSGPAFFASYINALLLFAEKSGFNKQESEVLINQTLLGTLEYLKNSNIKPDKFIKMVSSPGGTTESGINNLRKLKFEKIILDTHIVAKNKSKEMQKKISNKERK